MKLHTWAIFFPVMMTPRVYQPSWPSHILGLRLALTLGPGFSGGYVIHLCPARSDSSRRIVVGTPPRLLAIGELFPRTTAVLALRLHPVGWVERLHGAILISSNHRFGFRRAQHQQPAATAVARLVWTARTIWPNGKPSIIGAINV